MSNYVRVGSNKWLRNQDMIRVACRWCQPNAKKIAQGGLADHIRTKHLCDTSINQRGIDK